MPNFRDIVAATPQGQRISGPTMHELKLKDEVERRARQSAERNAILEMLTNQGKQISNRTAQLGNTQTAREMARYGNPTYERATINGQEVVITKDGNGRPIATDSLYEFMQKNKRPSSAAAPVQNLPIFGSSPVLPGRTQTRAPIGKTGIPYTGPSGNQSPVQQFLYEYTKGGGNEQSEKNLAEIAAKAQQSPPDPRPQWARPQQTLNPAQERLAPYLPAGLDPYQATARDWVKAKEALDFEKRSGGTNRVLPPGYDKSSGTAYDPKTQQIYKVPQSPGLQAEQNAEKEAALTFIDAKIASKDDLLDTITKAQGILEADQKTFITTTAGLPGVLGGIPGTEGYDLQVEIDTIMANLAFDRLQQMREASKTGGALGQVSERELILLQGAVASLDRGQSPENLAKNLKKIRTHYSRLMDALAAARQKQMAGVNPAATPAAGPAAAQEELVYNPSTGTLEPK